MQPRERNLFGDHRVLVPRPLRAAPVARLPFPVKGKQTPVIDSCAKPSSTVNVVPSHKDCAARLHLSQHHPVCCNVLMTLMPFSTGCSDYRRLPGLSPFDYQHVHSPSQWLFQAKQPFCIDCTSSFGIFIPFATACAKLPKVWPFCDIGFHQPRTHPTSVILANRFSSLDSLSRSCSVNIK